MTASSIDSQAPPRLLYALTEAPRVMYELTHLRIASRWLRRAPQGDGHGVMLLPGFLGSDKYNRPLIEYPQCFEHKMQIH